MTVNFIINVVIIDIVIIDPVHVQTGALSHIPWHNKLKQFTVLLNILITLTERI